jgi:hypothetical protein
LELFARAALRGELGAASLVVVEGEAVDPEGVAQEVEVLAGVADAGRVRARGCLRGCG